MSFAEIKDWFNSILMSVSAFGLTVNALWNTYITHKTRVEAKETAAEGRERGAALAEKLVAVDTKVEKVAVQTDGLTASLVNKAAEVGHEKGLRHGREEGEAKAATLEEGRQLGRDETKP